MSAAPGAPGPTVSWLFQERIFLTVSNYIFTAIFVGEMTLKVALGSTRGSSYPAAWGPSPWPGPSLSWSLTCLSATFCRGPGGHPCSVPAPGLGPWDPEGVSHVPAVQELMAYQRGECMGVPAGGVGSGGRTPSGMLCRVHGFELVCQILGENRMGWPAGTAFQGVARHVSPAGPSVPPSA